MIVPWIRDRTIVRRQVCHPEFAILLAELHQVVPETTEHSTWIGVAEDLQRRGVRSTRADNLLRELVRIHRAATDSRPSTILFLLFMPALISIQRCRCRWLPNADERWALICSCFLRALDRLDATRRPQRLGQKLLNDTARHLYDACAREWKVQARVTTLDPDDLDVLSGGVLDPTFEEIELRQTQDAAMRRLRSAVAAGVISQTDAYLVLGTRIYGAELADAARELGVPYERAKKRRQRAEATLGRPPSNTRLKKIVPGVVG